MSGQSFNPLASDVLAVCRKASQVARVWTGFSNICLKDDDVSSVAGTIVSTHRLYDALTQATCSSWYSTVGWRVQSAIAHLGSGLLIESLARGEERGVAVDVVGGVEDIVVAVHRVCDGRGGDRRREGLNDEPLPLLDVHERPVLGHRRGAVRIPVDRTMRAAFRPICITSCMRL